MSPRDTKDLATLTGPTIQGEFFAKDELPTHHFTVTKSNALIEAQYDLSASEQKLLNAAIAKINPVGDYPDGIPEITMSAKEISELTGIKQSNVYRFIRKAAERYHSIPIVKHDPDDLSDEPSFEVINIAHKSKWDKNKGLFSIKFHSDIEIELVNLAQYTKYALAKLKNLKSKYSIRLFELAHKTLNPKDRVPRVAKYPIDELKIYLGVRKADASGKWVSRKLYDKSAEFKRNILEPAITEVNEKTDVYMEYKAITSPGRKTITHIMFRFRYQTAGEQPTSEQKETRERLLKYFDEDKIQFFLDTYTKTEIEENINYLEERATSTDIKNPAGYLRHLLRFNIAMLPLIANPYSTHYTKDSAEYEFVRQHIMPHWYSLDSEFQFEFQKFGLNAKEIKGAMKAFKEAFEGADSKRRHQFSSSSPVGSEQWRKEFEEWASSPEMMDWGEEDF